MKNNILVVGTITFDDVKKEIIIHDVAKVASYDDFDEADEAGEGFLLEGYDSYTVISESNPTDWDVRFEGITLADIAIGMINTL